MAEETPGPKNGVPFLVAGGAAAVIALVIGATLFMGHLAMPTTSQTTSTSIADNGALFRFAPAQPAQKPRAVPEPTPTPLASPSAAPSAEPHASAPPSDRQRLAEARLKAAAAARAAALAQAAPPRAATEIPAKLARPATLASTFARENPAAAVAAPIATLPESHTPAPVAPAPTAFQVASAPQAQADIYAPGTVLAARFINRQEPAYPEIAREQDAHGTALVLVTIGPKGNVISARVSQSTGFQILDNAALEAARASTFQGPVIDGHPATATYRVTYEFNP